MVNQQLKDYVSEQLRVGVSREAIKSALLEAGWAERDATEALGMPQMNAVAKPSLAATAKPLSTSPAVNGVKAAMPVSIPAARVVGGPGARPSGFFAQPAQVARPSQPARPVQQMRPVAATPKQEPASPASFMNAVVNPRPGMKLSLGHRIAHAVMGLAILALGAGGTWLFLKNTDLVKQLDMAVSSREQLAAELGGLKTRQAELQAQTEDLRSENKGLRQALGIFVAPIGTTGVVQEMTVEGMLASGVGTAPYTLKMPAGVTLTLKNSRDAAVEQVLKPLVGANISILGRHTLGSKDITVLRVNGVTPGAAAAQ